MIKLTTQQLAQILNANLIGDGQAVVENINTDTRKAVSNSLFFALKGEHFDAHQYLDKAVEQGATALVVQQANTEHCNATISCFRYAFSPWSISKMVT